MFYCYHVINHSMYIVIKNCIILKYVLVLILLGLYIMYLKIDNIKFTSTQS